MAKTTNILDLNNRLEKVEKGNVAQNSYTSLKNKPKINGHILTGDKSSSDLGLVGAETGKGLSSNDYTNADKAIVDGVTSALEGKVNSSDIAFGDWLPTNGLNPLTEYDGFFCYSVNPDRLIYQGTPNGHSEYGTVFGCSKANYKMLVHIDIKGKFAVWSFQDNQWVES